MADGSLIFDTKMDSSGLKSGLAGVSGLASTALKGTIAGIGATGTAIAGLTGKSIQAYAEFEQLTGGVETLFGSAASTVEGYAKTAYKTAGLSANAYMDTVTSFSASLLQSLGGDTEKAAQKADQAVTDMADNANKMGTSIGSIQYAYQGFAKQNFTMLDNLKLGYGGTKEEMQRLLDDATKLSGVKYDLSSYADIVDAIHVVQTQMGITGTTAKEAATTISGSIDSMKGAYTNFIAGMADENADYDTLLSNLVDSIMTVVGNVAPRIIEALPNIINGFGELISQLGGYLPDIIAQLAPPFTDGLNNVFTSLLDYAPILTGFAMSVIVQLASSLIANLPLILDAAHQIADTILSGIGDAVPAINPVTDALQFLADNMNTVLAVLIPLVVAFEAWKATMAIAALITAVTEAVAALTEGTTLLGGVLAALGGPVTIIIAIIAALVAAFIYLWNNCDAFRNFWIGIWDNITATFSNAWNGVIAFFTVAIPNFINSIGDWFMHLPENIGYIIGLALGTIIQWGLDLSKWVAINIPKIIDGIVDFFKNLPGNIWNWLLTTAMKIVAWREDMIEKGKNAAKGLVDAVVDGIKNLPENMLSIGKNIVQGLWNGITGMVGWIKDKVSGFAGGVLDGVKDALGIHSPSRKFAWVGKMCVEGFEQPLEDYNPYDTLTKSMKANKTTMQMNYVAGLSANQKSNGFDYTKFGEATATALSNAGLGISVDGRTFGRIVKGVATT